MEKLEANCEWTYKYICISKNHLNLKSISTLHSLKYFSNIMQCVYYNVNLSPVWFFLYQIISVLPEFCPKMFQRVSIIILCPKFSCFIISISWIVRFPGSGMDWKLLASEDVILGKFQCKTRCMCEGWRAQFKKKKSMWTE